MLIYYGCDIEEKEFDGHGCVLAEPGGIVMMGKVGHVLRICSGIY